MKSRTNVDNKLSLILRIAIFLQSLELRHTSEWSEASLGNKLITTTTASEAQPQSLARLRPQFVSQALPLTQSQSLSSLALSSLPDPISAPLVRQASNVSNGCSLIEGHPYCTCYALDDGLLIDCRIEAINQMTDVLNSLISQPIKSFSVYAINYSLNSLPETPFQNYSSLEQIYISVPSLVDVGTKAFLGLETSLKSLSLVNSKLKAIPKTALSLLRSITALDLQTNAIEEVESYAFYGLPLVSLNLQSNLIHSLHEFSFGGLENTLVELVLINNKLDRFPLHAFRRLRRLETLKLQSNRISEITDDGFTRFTVLKSLDLQSNRFDHLDSRSFITTPNLVTLSLANNRLTILSDSSIFEHLLALETLDLSYNNLRVVDLNNLMSLRAVDLSNNHLHDIRFHNLPNLKEVFVSNNNILKLTNETFINSSSLSVIFLQHNAIQSIDYNTFHSLQHLLTLDLSCNHLKAIDPQLLKHSTRLHSLYLDSNLITDSGLEAGTFQELVELRDLRLQKNLLKRIRKGLFYSLPNLQELDLQMNQIDVIESLESLVNLQHLNIQSNRLRQLSDVFSKFPSSLRFLLSSHNSIVWLHNDSLRGQNQLEVVWLNHNKLIRLTPSLFRDLTSLQKIYLNNNEIQEIEELTFSSLPNLIYLNLENNNFNHLSADTFKGAVSLIELRLRNCNIMNVADNVFHSLKDLKSVDLSDNTIPVITRAMFSGDLPLEELRLSNVSAERIESNSFSDMHWLRLLDVSSNNMLSKGSIDFFVLPDVQYLDVSGIDLKNRSFDEKMFSYVKRLEYIDLSDTHLNNNQSIGLLFAALAPLQALKVLKLKANAIESIELLTNTSFDSKTLKSVVEVYFDDNLLDIIPEADVLDLMPSLQLLSLTRNRIKRVTKGVLKNNIQIKTLNISHNSVSVLESYAFDGLPQLQVIDLSHNVIRTIPSQLFHNVSSLESLHLDSNWLSTIPNSLLSAANSLSKLKALTLNKNPIVKIREDLSSTYGFPSLETLTINDANLSIVASNDFLGFPNLKILSLKNNRIQKLSPSALRPLTMLCELDLSANKLDIIPEERLSGLVDLKLLNVSLNSLSELPHFSSDLHSLQRLDISHNRITRVHSFGHLAESVSYISLRHNMIGWIANNAFHNMTSLKTLDLRQNFLTQLSDTVFESIEVHLQSISLSGNPFHCDCRLLSIYEWLESHSRLLALSDREELICAQPEKLKDNAILSLHPVDFCPVPLISLMEISKLESTRVSIRWEVQNDTLVGGFTLEYYLTANKTPPLTQKFLGPFERQSDIADLKPENWYTVCVQANGKYVRSESNKPTPYVIDHYKSLQEFVTSNRKCSQVRTLSYSERTLISLSTLGIIFGVVVFVVLMLTLCVLWVVYKFRAKRRRPLKSEVPEEYITYRHFSLPSSENVYS